MDVSSSWSAKATAKSTIRGQSSVSFDFKGNLAFNVYLSPAAGPEVIPQNSVAGRMIGIFDAQVSTPTRRVAGNGTSEWTVGGTYDPVTETVSVAIRSSGAEAKGKEIALGDLSKDGTPVAQPFSMALHWGWQARTSDWAWEMPWSDDASTILDLMKVPRVPVVPAGREADLCVVHSLPQTGLNEFQRLVLDLKEPEPQTVTQTFQDETGLGTRTTTWAFTLIPSFNIERDDRATDGRHSFVSTDSIRLHMAIPGVTVAKSGWAGLASWKVEGRGPLSGSGVPNQLPHSIAFSFQPNPGTRPTDGSTERNRPIQYTVRAAFEDIEQYFILIQDDADLLRQEYIDYNEDVVPSRSDCVAHPIDKSFNAGNYNLVIDGGMEAALDKVNLEFGKESQGTLRVVGGFRSPQRNKAAGDAHPGNAHVYGRALDLVPDPANADASKALYEACVRAGYHTLCEAAPGKAVPPGSPDAKHVHVDW